MKAAKPLCALALALVCAASFAADLAEPVPVCEDRMGRVFSDFGRFVRVSRRGETGFRPLTQRFDGGPLISDDDPVAEVSKPCLESMFIG